MSVFKHGARHGHRPTSESAAQTRQRHNLDSLVKSNIPDDEYFRANNGELVCTVCFHQPRFPNVASLSHHRGTPRHKGCAKVREDKEKTQNDLARLRAERPLPAAGAPTQPLLDEVRNYVSKLSAPSPTPSLAEPPAAPKQQLDVIYDAASGHYWDREKNCWSLHPPGSIDAAKRTEATRRVSELPHVKLQATRDQPPAKPWTPLPPPPPTPEQQAMAKQAEYEMRLMQRGWKKNADGKWLKDENVEFDSDEDAPPPPPPELLAHPLPSKR